MKTGILHFQQIFLHYYQKYDIGIPEEYEKYISSKLMDENKDWSNASLFLEWNIYPIMETEDDNF